MSRNTPPPMRSLYDEPAPEPEDGSGLGKKLLAGGLVLALLGGIGFLTLRRGDITGDVDRSRISIPDEVVDREKNEVALVLALDGWSAKILEGKTLTYRVHTPQTDVTGPGDEIAPADASAAASPAPTSAPAAENYTRAAGLTLVPASSDDLLALRQESPGLLAAALARMVTVDADLSCNKDKCTSGTGDVSLEYLLEPATIPTFGKSYQAWGIQSGLSVARLNVPATADFVEVSAPGFAPIQIPLLLSEAEDEISGPLPEINVNGFLKNRFMLSAGLGQLFLADPFYISGKAEPQTTLTMGKQGTTLGATAELEAKLTKPVFADGLAAPVAIPLNLSPSELTYRTSPTTGCGPGVLCIPGVAAPKVVELIQEKATICSPKNDGKALLVVQNTRLSHDFDKPVHQFGLYGPDNQEHYTNADKGRGIYTGLPPLVSNTTHFRWVSGLVFEGTSPALITIVGKADQGPDPAASTLNPPGTVAEVLANTKIHGETWKLC